jgi:hypothetical protein
MTDRIVVDRIVSVGEAGSNTATFDVIPPEIKFRGGQSARLDPLHPRAAAFAEALNTLQQHGLHAWVAVDTQTGMISNVRVPLVDHIRSVVEMPDGDVEVLLEVSASMHVLRKGNSDRGRLLEALKDFAASGNVAAITEDDEQGIIDVRSAADPPQGGGASFAAHMDAPNLRADAPVAGGAVPPAITPQRAIDLFGLATAASCNPAIVAATCIPFTYPDDGCYARAHLMCRQFLQDGVTTEKIWIYGRLRVWTPYNPNCQVLWVYHVAPLVRVTTGAGSQAMVLDPSLFSEPVTDVAWKQIQGDPGALSALTDAGVYYRAPDGRTSTDPDGSLAAQAIARFRVALQLRASQPGGPPPYARCEAHSVAFAN